MCKKCKWEKQVTKVEDTIERLDDLPDRALEFRESVEDKLRGMLDWMTKNKHVTPHMVSAIDNMTEAVSKWLGD